MVTAARSRPGRSAKRIRLILAGEHRLPCGSSEEELELVLAHISA